MTSKELAEVLKERAERLRKRAEELTYTDNRGYRRPDRTYSEMSERCRKLSAYLESRAAR